ncbi:hypothetical protein L798_10246 [Zootermopsis nevadensis]|uniref:CCHC-type domain-containing protein n=1 Tax=Zootermopsis nevadensis TaxID=136037 RepID=A0A067RSW2_ZOONE|nr:hypothetical protein L798_10246 [Zootermopsis nevadensis]
MDPGQRTHFVFSKRPRAVADLYALGRNRSNCLVAGRQRLDALGAASTASGSRDYPLSRHNIRDFKGGRCWNCQEYGHRRSECKSGTRGYGRGQGNVRPPNRR